MRSWLTLAVGVLIGQWLAFGGVESPADMHAQGRVAWDRHDYAEAARLWSRAAALRPDNPTFHYLRATALARLGQRQSAEDAFQLALVLDPSASLVRLVHDGLAHLQRAAATSLGEVVLPLEASRGVWVTRVTLQGGREARFLVDTGASVTVLSSALATTIGVHAAPGAERMQMSTLAGVATGPIATIPSLALAGLEVRDVAAVIHDPGLGVDGILGNSVLGRFTLTLDADRRVLSLRSFTPPSS